MKNKIMTTLIMGVMIASSLFAMPVKADNETVVNGTIKASTFDVSVSANATYTIDPNNADGTYFTASEIGILNNSVMPISLDIKSITASSNMTDVLNTDVGDGNKEDWYKLGASDSKSKIALALKVVPDKSTWRKQVRSTDIFFKEILDLSSDATINLGTINAGDTVTYTLDGFHGLAFDSQIANTNTITLSVSLAEE